MGFKGVFFSKPCKFPQEDSITSFGFTIFLKDNHAGYHYVHAYIEYCHFSSFRTHPLANLNPITNMSRAEVDLQISVKKACNTEEVPPKRKHVRACIVYTWDHKNSRAFWNAVKIQPLQSSEVQLFKSLIMIHKVLQEGHPNTLKDGYRNKDFLYSLSTVFASSSSYGRLINQYDRFLLRKLDFHRNNPGFNGTFEYEEYISLQTVNDPNEGYESILQLMDLQDLINELQKLIFATVHQTPNNLCKVSALVPLISESYGIYKFLTSMLRAMYQQLGDDDAMSALFERFNSQHFILRDFYTDCQSIKFLTSLITIPRLGGNAPNLKISDDSQPAPPEPSISVSNFHDSNSQISLQPTPSFEAPSAPPPVDLIFLQQTGIFDEQQQFQQEQQNLELQRQQQLQEQHRRQQIFEQQKQDQEQRMLQEQEALRQQQTQAHQSRVSELEHDLLMFKNQFDNDQTLLLQYDGRVKSLETELMNINETATQQIASKDEQIKNLEDQVNNWAKKYEALAKLYSQLRLEHLNLLAKFKKIQQKINSAQESIMKKEKFEKDLKAKNLELADLIRERDRARLDLDRVRASKDFEIEKLQAESRELGAQVKESGKLQSMNLTSIISKHQGELDNLSTQLMEKDLKLALLGDTSSLQEKLKEREMDLEIMQESLDSALQELAIAKDSSGIKKLSNLLDVILANNVRRIQDSRYELSSPMQAGNTKASPEYLFSIIDLCSDTATDFAQVFNNYIAEGHSSPQDDDDSTYSSIILASSELTATVNDLMLNAKGLSRNIATSEEEKLVQLVTLMLTSGEAFFLSLTSDALEVLDGEDEKIDFVIDCNVQFQHLLQEISALVDTLRRSNTINLSKGNIEDLVDIEMDETAKTISSATEFLNSLMLSATSGANVEVHESILAAALAITKAVAQLIHNATESQLEIVNRNKGTQSRREFYKKNNRWTEGLISASKAVAGATNILIQTADGVLKADNSHEQLIVACNEVAASTAQLVAAARVKANFMSKTQDKLEGSSGKVNTACKTLVSKVQNFIAHGESSEKEIDLSRLTPYEGKTLEMEQQVEILKLENSLSSARKKLAKIRKFGYRDDDSDNDS